MIQCCVRTENEKDEGWRWIFIGTVICATSLGGFKCFQAWEKRSEQWLSELIWCQYSVNPLSVRDATSPAGVSIMWGQSAGYREGQNPCLKIQSCDGTKWDCVRERWINFCSPLCMISNSKLGSRDSVCLWQTIFWLNSRCLLLITMWIITVWNK